MKFEKLRGEGLGIEFGGWFLRLRLALVLLIDILVFRIVWCR